MNEVFKHSWVFTIIWTSSAGRIKKPEVLIQPFLNKPFKLEANSSHFGRHSFVKKKTGGG